MDTIELHLKEIHNKVEHVILEKDIKEAKELIRVISSMDFELRNAVTGNAVDVQYLNHFNDAFNAIHWTDANKARKLINLGLQQVNEGRTGGVRAILVEIISLMPDNEKPETLG
jgi:molecular chaperone DnaK